MKTFSNGLTPKQTLIGLGVIVVLSFVAYIWVSQPDAKASTTTLQESVEMAQADYDLSQSQAKAAMTQYCENWKGLSKAKLDLAKATNIPSSLQDVQGVDCNSINIPSTF